MPCAFHRTRATGDRRRAVIIIYYVDRENLVAASVGHIKDSLRRVSRQSSPPRRPCSAAVHSAGRSFLRHGLRSACDHVGVVQESRATETMGRIGHQPGIARMQEHQVRFVPNRLCVPGVGLVGR